MPSCRLREAGDAVHLNLTQHTCDDLTYPGFESGNRRRVDRLGLAAPGADATGITESRATARLFR